MKVLFLSQRFLFPMDTGGKIRTGSILCELSQRLDITVVSNVEESKDAIHLEKMPELCHRFVAVPWQETQRYTFTFYVRLLFQSLSRYPISVLNDYSRDLAKAVEHELRENEYDLLICDFLQSTLNVDKVQGVPRLLFQHNVEAQITQRHLKTAKNPASRLFWYLQHRRMLRHEARVCREYDGVIAVSEEDKTLMQDWYGASRVYAIPTGVDTDFFAPQPTPETSRKLVFTGSMDWLPNEDAMVWFLCHIFPAILEMEPDTTLTIVGRKPSPRIQQLVDANDAVTLTGWVEDVRPYVADSAVYIVPIRIGGGTRIKIYEALAMGKAMVSTTVGAEGLPIVDGQHLLRADSAVEFRDAVVTLLRDNELRRALGDAAYRYVNAYFRWSQVAKRFQEICEDVVRTNVAR